jgi:chromosome segregation ATPase
VPSFLKGKSAENYQQNIEKYNKQLEELEGQEDSDEKIAKIAEIQGKLAAAEENLKKAETKEETKKAEKEAYDNKLSELAAKKAAAQEDTARLEEENKIKVLGGFFVYRAKPTTDSKRIEKILASQIEGPEDQFAQQGEITGMVLIKQSGDRTFMTYAPIDPKEYTVDKFMEYFKDTMLNNKYDDNIEKVFELEALGTLVNKLIVQPVEE